MSESTIATGIYTIENVDRHNDIVLADDKGGTLVAGSSAADVDPPLKARWMITRLRNRRYTISPAAKRNEYASWQSAIRLGSAIATSPDANDWVVQETSKKVTFVISHFHHQLYWGLEDGAQGSPVTLRDKPTGLGNRWRFIPCMAPAPDVLQSGIGAPTIDGSGTRKVDDGRPAIHHKLQGHTYSVFSIAFSPDGKRIVSGSADPIIRVWDMGTGHLALEPIEGHSGAVLSLAFFPDGKRIVFGSEEKTVEIWDTQSRTLSLTLSGHRNSVNSVSCSPDGKRVVSGSDDKTVRVWDVEIGRLVLGPILEHTGSVISVDFSKDGKKFLSGSADGTIRVWDAETGHAMQTFLDICAVWSAVFSPDGKQIVSAGGDGIVRVWDMQSRNSTFLRGHESSVLSVGFSPDGERIVSGGKVGQIIVWDAKSGGALGRLSGHTDDVWSVASSPDGKWIVSGSEDKTVRIWEADRLDAMPVVK